MVEAGATKELDMPVKPKPDMYHTVTPYLIVNGAARAIEFYQKTLGAVEITRFPAPDGKIGHAELKIGDSVIMLADEYPEMGARSPQTIGGSPVQLLVYVDDVDARFRGALAAGAKETRAVQDQFYGDRSGTLQDPFGHIWTLSTHKEDVSPEEMRRRAEEMTKQHSGA
jgi:PhnB protein